MPKNKVLIISYYFPPSNTPAAQRPYFMAHYLMGAGNFFPIVLTCNNSFSSLGYSDWADQIETLRVYSTGKNIKSSSKSIEGSLLNRLIYKTLNNKYLNKALKFISRNFLIPDKSIFWKPLAVKVAKRIFEEHDDIGYIYSTSPTFTNHLIAKELAGKYHLKWIVDIRDFHFVNNVGNNFFKNAVNSKHELNTLKLASYITFVSESMLEIYCKKYPFIRDKAEVIYNGYDLNEFENVVAETDSNYLNIFYAGSFYDGERSPLPLLLALEHLILENRINVSSIRIEIAGKIPEAINDSIKKLKIYDCIVLLGLIPRRGAIKKMKSSDLLWLIIGNKSSHLNTIPLKTFEYLAANRLILNFAPESAEANQLIKKLNKGVLFRNNIDNESIKINAELFFNLYQEWKLTKSVKCENVLKDSNDILDRKYQAKQLSQILNRLENGS